MKIFCTENFKSQFERLVTNSSYKTLPQDLIDFFFSEKSSKLGGTRLNGHAKDPFLKKRLNGSGGFRAYYYIVIKNDCLYLAFVHPKTGKYGVENISDEYKRKLAKEVLEAIKSGNVFAMQIDHSKSHISFLKTDKKL